MLEAYTNSAQHSYALINVGTASTLDAIAAKADVPFGKGCGFYRVGNKAENVSGGKEMVLIDKNDVENAEDEVSVVRKTLGVGSGTVSLTAAKSNKHHIFIQSTSSNRKIAAGSNNVLIKLPRGFKAKAKPAGGAVSEKKTSAVEPKAAGKKRKAAAEEEEGEEALNEDEEVLVEEEDDEEEAPKRKAKAPPKAKLSKKLSKPKTLPKKSSRKEEPQSMKTEESTSGKGKGKGGKGLSIVEELEGVAGEGEVTVVDNSGFVSGFVLESVPYKHTIKESKYSSSTGYVHANPQLARAQAAAEADRRLIHKYCPHGLRCQEKEAKGLRSKNSRSVPRQCDLVHPVKRVKCPFGERCHRPFSAEHLFDFDHGFLHADATFDAGSLWPNRNMPSAVVLHLLHFVPIDGLVCLRNTSKGNFAALQWDELWRQALAGQTVVTPTIEKVIYDYTLCFQVLTMEFGRITKEMSRTIFNKEPVPRVLRDVWFDIVAWNAGRYGCAESEAEEGTVNGFLLFEGCGLNFWSRNHIHDEEMVNWVLEGESDDMLCGDLGLPTEYERKKKAKGGEVNEDEGDEGDEDDDEHGKIKRMYRKVAERFNWIGYEYADSHTFTLGYQRHDMKNTVQYGEGKGPLLSWELTMEGLHRKGPANLSSYLFDVRGPDSQKWLAEHGSVEPIVAEEVGTDPDPTD